MGELEDQQADVRLELTARAEERRLEQAGIQEILIVRAGAQAEPRQVGKAFDGDAVGHLQGELEVRWHLGDKLVQKAAVGEFVVSRIHTDRLEHLRVFAQTEALETCLGELTMPNVTVRVIKLAPPAGILPGRSADENTLPGQGRRRCFHLFAVKRHAARLAQA